MKISTELIFSPADDCHNLSRRKVVFFCEFFVGGIVEPLFFYDLPVALGAYIISDEHFNFIHRYVKFIKVEPSPQVFCPPHDTFLNKIRLKGIR